MENYIWHAVAAGTSLVIFGGWAWRGRGLGASGLPSALALPAEAAPGHAVLSARDMALPL